MPKRQGLPGVLFRQILEGGTPSLRSYIPLRLRKLAFKSPKTSLSPSPASVFAFFLASLKRRLTGRQVSCFQLSCVGVPPPLILSENNSAADSVLLFAPSFAHSTGVKWEFHPCDSRGDGEFICANKSQNRLLKRTCCIWKTARELSKQGASRGNFW